MRVKVSLLPGHESFGTVWRPNMKKHRDSTCLTDYQIAFGLGLTSDPAPDSDRQFAMVQWDCRPGVLQVHYWDELEEVKQ